MKIKPIIPILVMLLSFHFLQGQTYEEYLRQQQAEFDQFRKEQQKNLDALRKDYTDFVKKRDKEFSTYLRQEWEKFKVFTGEKLPEKPKPKVIPPYKPAPAGQVNRIPALPPRTETPAVPLRLARIPMIQKPESPAEYRENISFDFCGEKVDVEMEPAFRTIAVKREGKEGIAGYWDEASGKSYNYLIGQLATLRQQFNVNDYGYYMLVANLADAIYILPGQEQQKLLFSWFLMVRSGYDVRIAYNNKEMALLLPSFHTLYGKPYLTIGNIKFYLMTPFTGQEIMTYEKTYDAANLPLDFSVQRAMNFTSKPVSKKVSMESGGKTYSFDIRYDPGTIAFYRHYPQVDPEVYFDAAVSLVTKESIREAFTPVLQQMKQDEAVNLLLAFVQHGFNYKTDPEQFGYEKFFFADELFYYPAADCEDRSVLFSYLVRNLLSLKMVGLESRDHMFTAVRFTTDAFGDYLTYKGEMYIVADPTYINAPFGRTMTTVNLVDARIIPLQNPEEEALTINAATELAAKAGIRKAGSTPNVVIDPSGNFFVTGYFAGTLDLGAFHGKTYVDGQAYIVARLDKEGKLLWADHIPCTDNATGLAINQDNQGNLFVAGSFTGKMLEFNTGTNSDVFLARYTATGDRLWILKGGLDTLPPNSGLIYSLEFGKNGRKENVRVVEYSPTYDNFGLFDNENSIVYNGYFPNTLVPATATLALHSSAELNYADLLKKEYDRFVSRETDKAVAGLFAISNIIGNTGMVIAGKDVQQAFDKYNPTFRSKCPNIYGLIGKVSFMKNSNNIITITTENGKDVVFDKLKLTNNSRLRVSILPDGNARVDAISGIKVGKMVIWYQLNFVKVFGKTGDLLFDYDKDHSQAKMNIKKDILN